MPIDLPLDAPNEQAEIQRTMDEHPEIDPLNEEQRGAIIDITALRLNNGSYEGPWGRKARSNDPAAPNLNTDGMTYLRTDGNFEIYDVISGTDGSATWYPYGPFAPGENGYWWPPQPYTGIPGGAGGTAYPPYQQPLLDRRTGHVTKPWHLFFLRLGGGGGGSVADGIEAGEVLLEQVQAIQSPRLLGRGTSGLGPVEQILLGPGLVMDGTTLSVTADISEAGYWSVITNGDAASPEVLFDSNGDAIMGWVPTPWTVT